MRILLDDSLAKPQTIGLFRAAVPDSEIYVLDGGYKRLGSTEYLADRVFTDTSWEWKDYLTNVQNLCEEYNIDVFVPRRYLDHTPDVFSCGTKIFAEDRDSMAICNNKCHAYNRINKVEYLDCIIPIYADCNMFHSVYNCINELQDNYEKEMMYKRKEDIGGASYTTTKVGNFSYSREYMIGEILKEPMISVDVFSDKDGSVYAIKREKVRDLRIAYSGEDLHGVCEGLYRIFKFKYIVNMQFMRSSIDGELKLLEINPRISGGIHMASKLIETNIVQVAMDKLLDTSYGEPYDFNLKHSVVADIPVITVLE